jgi:hypothetical protein
MGLRVLLWRACLFRFSTFCMGRRGENVSHLTGQKASAILSLVLHNHRARYCQHVRWDHSESQHAAHVVAFELREGMGGAQTTAPAPHTPRLAAVCNLCRCGVSVSSQARARLPTEVKQSPRIHCTQQSYIVDVFPKAKHDRLHTHINVQ